MIVRSLHFSNIICVSRSLDNNYMMPSSCNDADMPNYILYHLAL